MNKRVFKINCVAIKIKYILKQIYSGPTLSRLFFYYA
nr:MAG TPA: hypothetical protein [Caudoviricetes sp.]